MGSSTIARVVGNVGAAKAGRKGLSPAERAAQRTATTFRMAADVTRMKVLTFLAAAREASVGEIVAECEMSQPATSHHVGQLRRAGIAVARKDGHRSMYSLTPRGEALARMVLELGATG
jgi:DNA-binding transcriptional ArsR family regulator